MEFFLIAYTPYCLYSLLLILKNLLSQLLVFDRNTRNQNIEWKLFALDKNTWYHITKRLEKKLDGNYTRMLRAILNKSWRQHPTRHQLYGHRPPITKNIQVRWTRHAGHCWRSKDELINYVLLWTPAYDQAKAGRPAWTYIQQQCEDTRCSPEDLPEAMNDREKWREGGQGYPCRYDTRSIFKQNLTGLNSEFPSPR